MHVRALDRRELEAERRGIVEASLWPGEAPDDETKKIQRGPSLRRRLLNDVTTAAMDHALLIGADAEQFHGLASDGVRTVDDLQAALTDWSAEKIEIKKQWNFWRHEKNPLSVLKSKKPPHMDRSSIESAATSYLDLPYRADQLERTLVDVLVALELYAFGELMLTKYPLGFRWLPTRSPLQEKHVLRKYVGGLIWNAVIFLGGAWFAGNALNGTIAGILVFLFFAFSLLATVALPFAWWHQAKSRGNVLTCLRGMIMTYSELESNGVISTRRVREVAAKVAEDGAVWPGPLFAILDDNIARSGRL